MKPAILSPKEPEQPGLWGRWCALLLCLLSVTSIAQAQPQNSDDPADLPISSGLLYTINAQVATPLPASCGTSGSVNPASGDFTLSATTSTPAALAPMPPCGNFFDPPPATPNPANDAWFRLDPPPAPTRFRFTLFGGSVSPLTNGAMAVYEAPSSAGPFHLIECAVGGSSSINLPTLEVNSYTPGNKLYLRVWDESTRTSTKTFTICVQGQTDASLASRGAGETACSATLAPPTTILNIDYAFANEESVWLQADSTYVGGDLWLKLKIPPSGSVRMSVARWTMASSAAVGNIGMSAYLTSDCTDPTKFRQVGSFFSDNIAPTPNPLLTTVPGTPNWTINCLPTAVGDTLYLRIHSTRYAQTTAKRYGRFRFYWAAGTAPPSSPPSNNQPCGAIPLAFNVSCPVAPGPGGNTDACNVPGIPKPSCGGFDGNSRDVWYSFVAPPSGTVFIEATPGPGFPTDPAMALYTTGGNGCNGRFTLIECDDKQGVGSSARIIRTGLVPGQTYYIRAWAEGSAAQGPFSLCISEPVPPAGTCFYLIDLSAQNSVGQQFMDVSINGGAPTTYATSSDPSEIFLVAIPTGATALFEYYNSGTSGGTTYRITRLGDPTVLWEQTSGVPVFGPQPPLQYRFTLNNACQPLIPPISDCLGAETVCTPNTEFGTLIGTLQPGNRYDLTAANMGCLSTENSGIAWLIFRPTQNGTVAFWFDGTTNAPTTDLDFAIWDAGPVTYMPSLPYINGDICAPSNPPVRCSSARLNYSTGLQPGLQGVYQEGMGGWGWLSPLPVIADHAYLIALIRGPGGGANVQYQMRWTLYTDAVGTTDPNLMGCTPLVLPVELLSIDAQAKGQVIEVTWATASESNSSHFIIERSPDARTFSDIGSVDAAGYSQSRLDYRFTDEHPLPGANYYRLRQVDRDGRFAHSDIVVAFMDDRSGHPLLFPNPTTGRVDLLMDIPASGPVMVLITDAVGRALHTEFTTAEHGALRYPLDVSPLAPGAYFVQVVTADGRALGTAQLLKR